MFSYSASSHIYKFYYMCLLTQYQVYHYTGRFLPLCICFQINAYLDKTTPIARNANQISVCLNRTLVSDFGLRPLRGFGKIRNTYENLKETAPLNFSPGIRCWKNPAPTVLWMLTFPIRNKFPYEIYYINLCVKGLKLKELLEYFTSDVIFMQKSIQIIQ